MRLGVLTDAHANLPALKAALGTLEAEHCDSVVHTGDAIGIGPHPAECLDLLLQSGADLVMGNHDAYFAFGLDDWPYSAEELAHQRWVHEQLDPGLRRIVGAWPWEISKDVDGTSVLFTHYGRTEDGAIAPPGRNTAVSDLDAMFLGRNAEIVSFGHDHASFDGVGARRYLNPGSLGCHAHAEARALILEVSGRGTLNIRHLSVPYDDTSVFDDLERRNVPAREIIRRVFLPRDSARHHR